MRRFAPDTLRRIGCALFEAVGCTAEDARTVTEHLVESSLFGHDSHGILRYYEYVDFIQRGVFAAHGQPTVVRERGAMAVVDGGGAMGQVGGQFANELAIAKALEHGVGTVALRNTCHVGRVGAYPLAAARQGLIAVAYVNAGHLGRQIAPWGGIDGKLSTNPIAFAAPRRDGEPIMVDMATAVTAEGKIRVAHNRGESVPEGWIIDHEGKPTTDPDDYLKEGGGAILPLGGVAGYKGYCLGFTVEVLGGLLSGEGCAAGERTMRSNGVLFTVYDPSFFTEDDAYQEELESLIRHVYTSRVDPAIGEILLPGEPEFRAARLRQRDGSEVDDTTWARIGDAARGLGLNPDPWENEALQQE